MNHVQFITPPRQRVGVFCVQRTNRSAVRRAPPSISKLTRRLSHLATTDIEFTFKPHETPIPTRKPTQPNGNRKPATRKPKHQTRRETHPRFVASPTKSGSIITPETPAKNPSPSPGRGVLRVLFFIPKLNPSRLTHLNPHPKSQPNPKNPGSIHSPRWRSPTYRRVNRHQNS